ncbi:amidase family protein [Georgenia sp. H159]|uniref:amidase family protein n=1 Tax=Georgenia sp. H159 TaxID=3076115 RepID=UPI002D76EBFD|nr:amidase family protein [Georgenia sp. H159]
MALTIADSVVEPRGSRRPSNGRLLDRPVGIVKDSIAVDGLPLTCGSPALEGWYPKRDAHAVRLLRESGAVIAGKANLSEWDGGRSGRQVRGWSGIGGQLGHPRDTTYSPGGSSSGSAVAVALGLVDWALGTETVGSVVQPASLNGIFGLKPTHGVVSSDGLVPSVSPLGQSTIGILTRDGEQLSPLLKIMSGRSVGRNGEAGRGDRVAPGGDSDPRPLPRSLTLVTASPIGCEDVWASLVDTLLELFRVNGTDVRTTSQIMPAELLAVMQTLLSRESNAAYNGFLRTLPPRFPQSLSELIHFNDGNRTGVRGYDDQEWLESALGAEPLTPDNFTAYKATRHQLRENAADIIEGMLQLSGADFLVGITERPSWKIDLVRGDPEPSLLQALPCISGYPHLTVPGLTVEGWPVGVSIIGRPHSDLELLEVGNILHRLLVSVPAT